MSWIGLIVGILLGAVIGKLPGALALGFLGRLVGFVIAAQKKPAQGSADIRGPAVTHAQAEPPAPWRSLAVRLDSIERRLAALEKMVIPAQAGMQDEAQPLEPVVAPLGP